MAIQLIGGGRPAIPEGFRARLHSLDPELIVSWNERRHRWVIEHCDRHFPDAQGEHTHVCARSYVLLVQEDGKYAPLSDRVLEEIKARDVTKAGYGPDDLRRFCADMDRIDQEKRSQIETKMAETVKFCSRDNRRQLLQAVRLMQNHSLEVNQ